MKRLTLLHVSSIVTILVAIIFTLLAIFNTSTIDSASYNKLSKVIKSSSIYPEQKLEILYYGSSLLNLANRADSSQIKEFKKDAQTFKTLMLDIKDVYLVLASYQTFVKDIETQLSSKNSNKNTFSTLSVLLLFIAIVMLVVASTIKSETKNYALENLLQHLKIRTNTPTPYEDIKSVADSLEKQINQRAKEQHSLELNETSYVEDKSLQNELQKLQDELQKSQQARDELESKHIELQE
ncbi:MAG: hypothetical protein U9N42_00040, partial [Campylobacterota bacterium]|nr:hypothetical protein [Campylobacterota bacterium]